MVTYFHLAPPGDQGLIANCMKGAPIAQQEIRRCPLTADHLDGARRTSDLALQVAHDRNESMVWSWLGECLVHRRLADAFREGKITGYRTRPATLRFRNGDVSLDYLELITTGWAGVARPESGIRLLKNCPGCHWKKYSPLRNSEDVIDWSEWTGEDFFFVWPMPKRILITDKVADLLLRLDIRHFELGGLQDSDSVVANPGFTVGRLSNFMPEELAIKYGTPLGLE